MMNCRKYAVPVLTIAALALAGCNQEKNAADTRGAAGEVLPGSASDAMLPLDTVRSQPPLAPRSDAAKDGSQPKGTAAKPGKGHEGKPAAAREAAPPDATPNGE